MNSVTELVTSRNIVQSGSILEQTLLSEDAKHRAVFV
jgi:hypothetical protein